MIGRPRKPRSSEAQYEVYAEAGLYYGRSTLCNEYMKWDHFWKAVQVQNA